MNISILQHVPFEGAGCILPYLETQGHQVDIVRLYEDHRLPNADDIDLLIVMGGPMSTRDVEEYPHLTAVRTLIRDLADMEKWVLGICLGAQLIAEALGAKVRINETKEIGWFPVQQTADARLSWLADILPCEFTCMHWHGETFDIPEGAVHLARSEACENQAFVWRDKVIGLQFHLEFGFDSIKALVDQCQSEVELRGDWIQTEQQMLAEDAPLDTSNYLMNSIIEHIQSEIEFDLHPQLAADCHHIADFDCARVLLNKNAEIPWFILVPRGDFSDLDDMPRFRRDRLIAESDYIADVLRNEFHAEKINVAAIGNMVPQLHLHVIGRRSDDICWPKPVWGHLNSESEWRPEQIASLKQLLNL